MKCKLCLQEKELQNSHIIPEFLYKSLYDDKHRFYAIPTEADKRMGFLQKGVREELLCSSCDKFLGQLEDYAKRVIYGTGVEIEISKEQKRGNIIISNIDYSKFKLFQLSILWRAGIAKNKYFANVNLGPHEEKLRQMLINKNPGRSYDYGSLLIALLMDEDGLFEIIRTPDCIRSKDGYKCYRFLMGGFLWLYVVAKHSNAFKHNEDFLQERGVLTVRLIQAKNTALINRIVSDLLQRDELNRMTH